MTCSRSVSGSSLLSGYDEDDARETSGRSRREFEQIDAVLYDEEAPKRSSIKKICDEWSSKPHFRIRGYLCPFTRPQQDLDKLDTRSSTLLSIDNISNLRFSSFNSSGLNALVDETVSGRSSLNSIEGSEISNDSELDDEEFDDTDGANTILGDRFSGSEVDSFDTDQDDDDVVKGYYTSNVHENHRVKHPQQTIKCLKDSVINALATSVLQALFTEKPHLLQNYAKHVCANHSVRLRNKLRPSSSPSRSSQHNRSSITASIQLQPSQLIIPSSLHRSTPEPHSNLTDILLVKGLQGAKSSHSAAGTSSPRKSLISLPHALTRVERASTLLAMDRRTQQQQPQIALTGTAIGAYSSQVTPPASQSSQNQSRQISSIRRYDSTTTINSCIPNSDSVMRLPPIPTDPVVANDLPMIQRSHTMSTPMIETVSPLAARIVSGKSTGSNFSSTVKGRPHPNLGKLQRTSRSITIPNSKELNNPLSISPSHLIATTGISPTILKTTSIARTHHPQQQQQSQQQTPQRKKSLMTPKSSTTSCSSSAMKVPATHIC